MRRLLTIPLLMLSLAPSLASASPPARTSELVLSKIRSTYLSGLRRCFNEELKHDPHADGRFKLDFSLDALGRTHHIQVTGPSARLSACVRDRVASWRFSPPAEPDPRFTITLNVDSSK